MKYTKGWMNFERIEISEGDFLIDLAEVPVYKNVLLDSEALMRG